MKTQLNTNKPVHLDIALKPGAWVEPGRYIRQIADAGYEARKDDIRLTLTGKIVQEGEKLLFTLEDVKPGPQKFVLAQAISKDPKEAKSRVDAFQETRNRVGETVEMEGFWKPADKKKDKDALPSLSVLRVTAIKPEDKERR